MRLKAVEDSGFPGAVEGGLLGAVDAQVDEPAHPGFGLHTAMFLSGRGGGCEVQVEVVGAIRLAACASPRRSRLAARHPADAGDAGMSMRR